MGQWSRAEKAIDFITDDNCDVIIMDLKMPKMSGAIAARKMQRKCPALKIIILSAYTDNEDVFKSIDAGVLGYLPKEVSVEELVSAVRQVYRGYAFLDPSVTRSVLERFSHMNYKLNEEVNLTNLELDILEFASKGFTNREIAERMEVKHGAVKHHLREIFRKLEARDRAHAVALAIKQGHI